MIHKFEKAGLGKAPFFYAGYRKEAFKASPDSPEQPAGSCKFCGMALIHVFSVRSSDGKTFDVGCDCIEKVGDAGLVKIAKTQMSEIQKATRRAYNEKRRLKEAQRAAAALAAVKSDPAIRAELTAQPHPHPYFASQGKTMLDSIEWLLERGNIAATKQVETMQSKGAVK